MKTRKVYSDKDFNSGDGMLTTVWGPSMWHVLHTMSFNYPVEPTCDQKKQYMEFVYSLKHVLPCGKCRKNLCKNLKKLPLKPSHMVSRSTFSKYVYDLHELVNTMLHKKSGLSYDDVRERYEHFRSRCTKSFDEMKKDRQKTIKKHTKKENGCTEPLYGEKSRCILKIVPQSDKCSTFQINSKCIKRTINDKV